MSNLVFLTFRLLKGLRELFDPASYGHPYLTRNDDKLSLTPRLWRKMFFKF
jgi:hypothetical protein